MGDKTGIQWTDATWNCLRGCSITSPGCTNCYAMKQAHRFSGPGQPYEGLTKLTNGGPVWTGQIKLVEEKLEQPLRWKKPRRIFVNSMSDLFHDGVPDDYIDQVFAIMAIARHHTFQVLTKRPERMRAYCASNETATRLAFVLSVLALASGGKLNIRKNEDGLDGFRLPNVWLGVSVEDQARADERIGHLLRTPAAIRFLSVEPLLGPVQLGVGDEFFDHGVGDRARIDWVIVGSESGPKRRPMEIEWARSLVDQCAAAHVPIFVKQISNERDPKGGDPQFWPAGDWPREFPR